MSRIDWQITYGQWLVSTEYKHGNQWTGHESRALRRAWPHNIERNRQHHISRLRIRVRLSSEQFEPRGRPRPRFRVLVSSQLLTRWRTLLTSYWSAEATGGLWLAEEARVRCWGRAIGNQRGQDNSGTLAKVMQYFAITCGTLQLSRAQEGPGHQALGSRHLLHHALATQNSLQHLASGLSGMWGYGLFNTSNILANPTTWIWR